MFYQRMRGIRRSLAASTTATLLLWPLCASAQIKITRANVAKTASFTVTQTTAPKNGAKLSQVIRVEVKGNNARVEMDNRDLGSVTYLANTQGMFFYIPANKVAQKQPFQGGAEEALRLAFRQVNEQLRTAKKTGTAIVSGQTTDVYKDGKTGAMIYVGRNPGFRLPVKTVLATSSGTQTFLVSNIKTNISLSDARFALPAGVRVIDGNGAAGTAPRAMGGGR